MGVKVLSTSLLPVCVSPTWGPLRCAPVALGFKGTLPGLNLWFNGKYESGITNLGPRRLNYRHCRRKPWLVQYCQIRVYNAY